MIHSARCNQIGQAVCDLHAQQNSRLSEVPGFLLVASRASHEHTSGCINVRKHDSLLVAEKVHAAKSP